MSKKKTGNFPYWPILLLLLLTGIVFILPSVLKSNLDPAGYALDQVVLSTDLLDYQPVDAKNVFKPSDTIVSTVTTTGVEGVVGMKWYFGNDLLHEQTGTTQNHTISGYIQSTKTLILQEGQYRVDIFIADKLAETVDFEVEIVHPNVEPSISPPANHFAIEQPWYPEVPFVFDEIWKIEETDWKINEVKVVLMKNAQESFVAITVHTDMKNILLLIEPEAKKITRPIALYALENNYLERARALKIDGVNYDLNQYLFVNFINPTAKEVYRVKFQLDELKR